MCSMHMSKKNRATTESRSASGDDPLTSPWEKQDVQVFHNVSSSDSFPTMISTLKKSFLIYLQGYFSKWHFFELTHSEGESGIPLVSIDEDSGMYRIMYSKW